MMTFRSSLSVAALAFMSACTAPRSSFVQMGHTTAGVVAPTLSDGLALNYSDAAIRLLRAKYNGARVAREVSSIAQLGLATATGASAAFGYGARTIAMLGIGSVTIPELQRIVDARGRAQVYQDAVRLIEEAQFEYLSLNQSPSSTELTQNGVTLLQRTTASIHLVEKSLAGTLPTVEDMQKATEPMSMRGANPTAPGDIPVNNIPANPAAANAARAREAAFNARVNRALDQPTIPKGVATTEEIQKLAAAQKQQMEEVKAMKIAGRPDFVSFRARLGKVDTAIPAEKKPLVYGTVFRDIGIPDPASVEALKALTGIGFNAITLNEVYHRFPDKQVRILEHITALEANPNEPAKITPP